MSTTSGFILGIITSATLTVMYGEQLSTRLQDAVAHHPQVAARIDDVAARASLEELQEILPRARRIIHTVQASATDSGATEEGIGETEESIETVQAPIPEPGPEPKPKANIEEDTTGAQPTLEQRWAEYSASKTELSATGEFPWRACFQRAAAAYELPETLLLAIASGESNFDPAARSDKDAVGLMQVRWPGTSRHLGIHREADLYDPCTNVDAGARYISELAAQFNNNYHLVVAAYNYGPGRISAGQIPEGARWYSQYIYQHLQQVLGEQHIPTSELIDKPSSAGGHQVLMTFNQSYRARDYLGFLRSELPDLNLQQKSEALGHHAVVLLYQDENERLAAMRSLDAAGIATLTTNDSKLYL